MFVSGRHGAVLASFKTRHTLMPAAAPGLMCIRLELFSGLRRRRKYICAASFHIPIAATLVSARYCTIGDTAGRQMSHMGQDRKVRARSADSQALERVLDQWAVSWSSGDVDMLLPLFTDDVRYEDVTLGAVNQGKNALRDFAATTFGAFADLKFELKSRLVAADGRSGAMEWIWRGRQTKDLPGLPATNKTFEVRGATVVEFTDGKISRNSDYWDLATYMKQVGLTK